MEKLSKGENENCRAYRVKDDKYAARKGLMFAFLNSIRMSLLATQMTLNKENLEEYQVFINDHISHLNLLTQP